MRKINKANGFTLIEVLVVIGIIAVLATIVIVAINPAKQFAQTRNTQRTNSVVSILNAINQRMADNKGVFAGAFTIGTNPAYNCGDIPATSTPITDINGTNPGELGCLVPTYISSLPLDPQTGVSPNTGYTVQTETTTGRVRVCAPASLAETSLPVAPEICITR